MSDLENAVREAVCGFRVGQFGLGHDALARIVEGLAARLQSPEGHGTAAALLPILRRLLDSQQRGDVLALADLLQHELAPALKLAGGG